MMLILAHIRDKFPEALFPRLAEWGLAGMLATIGCMLSLNPALMANPDTNAYDLMRLIASQQTWSMIMITFAVGRIVVLTINGAWRKSPHLRWTAALISMFFWMQIMLSFKATMGFAFCFAIWALILDFANMLHAARDARRADHAFQQAGHHGAGK